jgi:exodeoxyribonuclease V alpha subunit
VVIPLTTGSWMMLRRNLLYTAISQAKRLAVLAGSRRPLAVAVRTSGGPMPATKIGLKVSKTRA